MDAAAWGHKPMWNLVVEAHVFVALLPDLTPFHVETLPVILKRNELSILTNEMISEQKGPFVTALGQGSAGRGACLP